MKMDVYNQAGKKTGTTTLNKTLFGAEVNEGLMHQALVRQQTNGRYNLSRMKTRAQVNGGGRKPFRQKGTGRARQGTIRAPHMKGGGVVFGPTGNQNFSLSMPKKQRRAALFSALTFKASEQAIFGLEGYEGEISTKKCAAMIAELPVERNVLFVLSERNTVFEKSVSNIPNAKVILAPYLNIADLLKYRKLCFLSKSEEKLEEIFVN